MSSFEVIGSILDLYARVQHSLTTSRTRGAGRHAESFEKDFATEEVIFREFLHTLLPANTRASPPQGTTRPTSVRSPSQASQSSVLEPSPPYAMAQSDEARGESAYGAFVSYLRGTAMREAVSWYDLALGSPASPERLFAPETAQRILEGLKEIQDHLRVIEQELNASPVGRRNWFSNTFPPTRSSRRDSSQVSSSNLPERLSHLHSLNERLRRLPEPPKLPSEPVPVASLQRQYSTSLHHEIDAEDVYHAIKTGYRCECNRPHPAKLGLPRIRQIEQQASMSTGRFPRAGTGFSLLFSTDDGISPELLEDSTLSLVTSTESLRIHSTNSSQSLQRFETASTVTTQDDHDKRSPGLMSSIDSATTLSSSHTKSSRSKSCAVVIAECHTDRPEIIRDLCDSVKRLSENSSPRPATTIGVLRSRKRKRYSVKTRQAPENPPSWDMISLEDLFSSNQSRLSRKDRIVLALRLSHAVLSFYSTPWISQSWSWRDFSMTRAEKSQADCQLFVSHDFYSTEQAIGEAEDRRPRTSDFLQTYIGEPTLTRLGFALTELAFGRRLEELRTDKERQIQDPEMQDYSTVKRILDEGLIRDEENEQYEDIVRVCLTHRFRSKELHLRSLSSEEPSFQADAEQLVVAPLHGAWAREWPSSVVQAVH